MVVGNWNNSAYGRQMRAEYGSYTNIILLDPIYDQRKLDVLRGNALVYIHGHSAGGTNPSLVEAMYLGLPVLAYGVSYNRTTTEGKALYFNNAAQLKQLIENTSVYYLKNYGNTMRQIAERRYNWKLIAHKYKSLIEEALVAKGKIKVLPSTSQIAEERLLDLQIGHLKYQQTFFEKR